MNCGLGNLDSLRKNLLASTLKDDTTFDERMIDIGRGVARLFDRYCNRSFMYMENYTQIFQGDRDHWYLPRSPLLVISNVEIRYFQADDWTSVQGQPLSQDPETGLLHFGYTLGRNPLQVRVTWSGGYWFQTLEPECDGYLLCNSQFDKHYPGALPESIQTSLSQTPPGIEPFKYILPDDLRLAWLLQCRHIWASIDKLGLGMMDKPNEQSAVAGLKLSDEVKEILNGYKRYQLT